VSNDTYLLSTESPTKPAFDRQRPSRLLQACYSILLFWYALFDESSIVDATDEDRPRYPALTKATKPAILRACSRWPGMAVVLGEEFEPLFASFVGVPARRDVRVVRHVPSPGHVPDGAEEVRRRLRPRAGSSE
jgi:hypothetical protein